MHYYARPYSILHRLRSNAYLFDLSSNMFISLVYNVADLFSYLGTFEPPALPSSIFGGTSFTPVPHAPFIALEPPEEILDVLNDKFVTFDSGGYCRFLIR